MKTISLFVSILLLLPQPSLSQVKDTTEHFLLLPLRWCCENGQATGRWAEDDASIFDIDNDCSEVTMTTKECIDRTRLGELCSGEGSLFCTQYDGQSYPRYYALNNPIGVSPTSLNFTATYGGANPSSQTYSVSNGVWNSFQEDSILHWSATDDRSWLSESPTSANVCGSTAQTVTVSVSIAGLSPGSYSGIITNSATEVSNWHSNRTVDVNLTVAGVVISGPTTLGQYQQGIWVATAGGSPPFHYQWQYLHECEGDQPPCDEWTNTGSDNDSLVRSDFMSFELRCVVTDNDSHVYTSNVLFVEVQEGKAASGGGQSPELMRSHPNPFNPTTKIVYELPASGSVSLIVYDMLGREVATLAQGHQEIGVHTALWTLGQGSNASGMYYARLVVRDETGNVVIRKTARLVAVK